MNLSARERQALRSIEGGLATSDPDLAAHLGRLSRLMVDGDRPAPGPCRVSRRQLVLIFVVRWLPQPRGRGHVRTHSRMVSAMLVIWLAVSCALIATAAALSHVTPGGGCAILASVNCGSRAPVSPSQPGAR